LIIFAQTMPATIFSFAVGFFTFVGLAIPPLRFTVIFSFPGNPARVTAVNLSPEASPADTENQSAPSAINLDQQQNAHASVLAISRRMQ
jgi:hypothetical protein